MPGSSGKHSLASKYIDTKYGKKCLFCGEEDNVVTKAHIVAGNQSVDYSAFSKPAYKDNLDVKSPRNFLPLCGMEGVEGSCHNEFDKYLMTLIYNPIERIFVVRCLRNSFPKYHICNEKIVNVDAANPPYRRLLAWRTRKCIMEHQHLIPPGDVEGWIQLCNFSEQSRSIAQETDDAEVEAAESGSSCLKEEG